MFQTQKQKADVRGACYLTNSLPAEVKSGIFLKERQDT